MPWLLFLMPSVHADKVFVRKAPLKLSLQYYVEYFSTTFFRVHLSVIRENQAKAKIVTERKRAFECGRESECGCKKGKMLLVGRLQCIVKQEIATRNFQKNTNNKNGIQLL